MSRFVEMLLDTAAQSTRGIVTGEPKQAGRRGWGGVPAPGVSVAVWPADPAMIAPAVQAVWLAGGSVTMLHQPTPRTDLAEWSEDTVAVLGPDEIGRGHV